jgi:hypothetical protein
MKFWRQRRQSEAERKKGDWSWIGWKARLHGSNRTRKKNKGHRRDRRGVSDFGKLVPGGRFAYCWADAGLIMTCVLQVQSPTKAKSWFSARFSNRQAAV